MIELIMMCAPDIAPDTIQKIIQVESGGDPLAIHINQNSQRKQPKTPKPKSIDEAVQISKAAIEAGYSIDMGLMQINSQNLDWLGLETTELQALFTPCANIAAGAALLKESYERAASKFGPGQDALKAALSAYNTGSFSKGFQNGYLSRYYKTPSQPMLKQAMESSTSVHWNPPPNYYPKDDNTKGDVMTQEDQNSSKEILDEIDPTQAKAKYLDAAPGLAVEFDPEEAEQMGAFVEDALSLEDAMDASTDPREAE